MTREHPGTGTALSHDFTTLLGRIFDDPELAEQAVIDHLASAGEARLARRTESGWRIVSTSGNREPSDAESASLDSSVAQPVNADADGTGYAIISPGEDGEPLDAAVRRQICTWLALCRSAFDHRDASNEYREELNALSDLVKHVLTVRDLDQVLLTITTETLRMSDSDICGVFLREGDEVQMQSCVGHRLMETARLRMSAGQGVAGMVLETRAPARVDSYLQDERISTHFMSLAEQEETRSALAVPLILGDDLIGVLEVWRRRYSSFTERDVRRLEELADLATIAIDNARLYDSQRLALSALESTKVRLKDQVELLDETARLQKSLIDIVLDNGPVFPRVARTLAEHLDCTVAVLTPDGTVDAVYPRTVPTAQVEQAFNRHRESVNTSPRLLTAGICDSVWVQPIEIGNDQFGAVCAQGTDLRPERIGVACSQAAVACTLFYLQQRAASLARAEALDQIMWDLMDGSPEQRSAARSRAQQMGVRLNGWHRILYGAIENLESTAGRGDASVSAADRSRRAILRTVREVSLPPQVTLASVRGNRLVALLPIQDRDRSRSYLKALNNQISTDHPGITIAWGLSTAREHPGQYTEAYSEARTALTAARRLGGASSLYDDLGIVRLLLGHEDADFHSFVYEITGPLQAYDQKNDGALMKTLQAYFDSNCSQKDAAELLYVHHKTLAYRLDQIRKLTGLDLSQHSDRMRADLALRLLDVSEQADDSDAGADLTE